MRGRASRWAVNVVVWPLAVTALALVFVAAMLVVICRVLVDWALGNG